MKNRRIIVATMLAVASFMLIQQVHAKTIIKVSEIPESIANSVEKMFPNAHVKRAKINRNHTEYDIYGVFPDSRTFMIIFRDSAIASIEENLTEKTIPKAIMGKVKKVSPNCSIDAATKETTGDEIVYEIDVKTPEGNKDKYVLNSATVIVSSIKHITVADLPITVKKYIGKTLPGSTIKNATEKTDRENVFYMLDIINANRTHILWTIPSV